MRNRAKTTPTPVKLFNDGLTYYSFYDSNKDNYIFANYWAKAAPLMVGGINYKTPEHYFQSQKFTIKSAQWWTIMGAASADQARLKALGLFRDPANKKFKDQWFAGEDYQAMVRVVEARYEQDADFKHALNATGTAYILEDTYKAPPSTQQGPGAQADMKWGGGPNGMGENLLGMALMQVRNEKLGQEVDLDKLREKARDERRDVDTQLKMKNKTPSEIPFYRLAKLLPKPSTTKKVQMKLKNHPPAKTASLPHKKKHEESDALSPQAAAKLAEQLLEAFQKLEELLKKIDTELDRLIEVKKKPEPEAKRLTHN